jgi:RHH-type transcriptional regulator, rel operon repressor / antitoxin RelB
MKRPVTGSASQVAVMARVNPKLKRRLQALAKSTKRSESYLAAEAIAQYVSLNEWQVARIKASYDEWSASGTPSIPHEEVARWLSGWGTDEERPPPKPRR